MIVKCLQCNKYFDDEFRVYQCPHVPFLINNGHIYLESWLSDHEPKRGFSDPGFEQGHKSEYDKYQEWLSQNDFEK